MNKTIKLLSVLLVGMILTACGTVGEKRTDGGADVGDSTGMGAAGDAASTSGLAGPGAFTLQSLDDPASPLANRVIYFEYDKSDVSAEGMSLLETHGAFLAAYPDVRVSLEGHADERGSREYNIALGERRAQAVRRLLMLQGASDSQVETVSYGEERPVALGHEEDSWWRNRRVEIVYQR